MDYSPTNLLTTDRLPSYIYMCVIQRRLIVVVQSPDWERKNMRLGRILIVVYLVSLLVEVNLVDGGGGKLQDSSVSEGNPFKTWRNNNSSSRRSFNRGRFVGGHGGAFRLEGNNASKEQKRRTPSGANRLHNL